MSGGHYANAEGYVQDVYDQLLSETVGIVNDETSEPNQEMLDQFNDRMKIVRTLSQIVVALKELDYYDSNDTSDWKKVVESFDSIGRDDEY